MSVHSSDTARAEGRAPTSTAWLVREMVGKRKRDGVGKGRGGKQFTLRSFDAKTGIYDFATGSLKLAALRAFLKHPDGTGGTMDTRTIRMCRGDWPSWYESEREAAALMKIYWQLGLSWRNAKQELDNSLADDLNNEEPAVFSKLPAVGRSEERWWQWVRATAPSPPPEEDDVEDEELF